ncbi:Ribosomal protein S6 kinase delta-1 [Echinococcus granulosus]|uniref:Ribosomal protein S6 kinase delta 1 n=1 Tax=Echinococcus granulosus TaxID=6210 RepID=A0A068W9B9_ECHGR|nr:Ribosomal protein S6 kinase delta-1 [Echinococcus granulosus]CDS16633.1 ribosomal protein S6 kinase delta 1 [Echinococcus granulosus]
MAKQRELDICVDQSCLHPGGNYTIYRVVIQRFWGCDKEEKILYKRFSDFLRLHRQLSKVYEALNCSTPFPDLSKKTYFNRFQSSVIEARLRALDDFVKFIASNEYLYCHTYFTRFVTGGFPNRLPSHNSIDKNRFSSCPTPPSSLSTPTTVVPPIQAPPSAPSEIDANTLLTPKHFEVLCHPESPLSSSTDSELEGDFLPLVWESISSVNPKILADIQAAKRFSREGYWKDAFRCYKVAASNLLKELKSDFDRKDEYRCLLSACLSKAEFIHREHILHTSLCKKRKGEEHNRPAWLESPKLASLCRDAALLNLFGSAEELTELRVCRIEGEDLVVYNRLDSSVKYTLKSRSLSSKIQNLASSMSTITSAGLKTSPRAERILPVGRIAFMSRLHRLVETADHSRLFLLVERTRGELRLVDWLAAYLQRRISALLSTESGDSKQCGRGDTTAALKHLVWCKKRSVRIREVVDRCLKKKGERREEGKSVDSCDVPKGFTGAIIQNCSSCSDLSSTAPLQGDFCSNSPFADFLPPSAKEHISPDLSGPLSPLLTPAVILNRYPPWPLPPPRRSHSVNDRLPFLREPWLSSDEDIYNHRSNCHEIPLLPERRSILWAAELVSVVSWLHARQIVLSHLDRSRVYLTQSGHIEIDYFFRWDTTNAGWVSQLNKEQGGVYVCAPELLVGRLASSFLCGSTWEKRAVCDWWSVGVILYEVFTGLRLHETHPRGIMASTPLKLPPTLSLEVVDFLTFLLKLNPNERLSDSTVKRHPIFGSIDWSHIDDNGLH